MKLKLGISPCPNDTFIFGNWIQGNLPGNDSVQLDDVSYFDIETLNEKALNAEFDIVKVSFHAVGALLDNYALLNSGGALGRGCGPLVVSKEKISHENLAEKKIAIPGKWTTAALLMKLWIPEAENLVVLPFHEIMPAIESGNVDAGLIIHESRFTYPDHGLQKVVDLGEWWEEATGYPIPLGGIMVRRDLDSSIQKSVEYAIQKSLVMALLDDGQSIESYIARHAQEMDSAVRKQHISLYVNDFSLDYGEEGLGAIVHVLTMAEKIGMIPPIRHEIFVQK